MNPTFGASILSWIPPMWTPEAGLFAIQQASAAGFDLLEILLPPSMEFDAPTVKRQLKQHGLKATCSLNLPKEAHIPFYPKKATCLIKEALDKASTDLMKLYNKKRQEAAEAKDDEKVKEYMDKVQNLMQMSKDMIRGNA